MILEVKVKKLAPVILFVYNRLDVLRETVGALRANPLSEQSELFIFSDGPKTPNDEKVAAVREYIKTIDGFKKITIFCHEKNKGLAESVISGVSKIVDEYGKVIVLEDDISPAPNFLRTMNEALDLYADEAKVACISAYTYPVVGTLPHSFFIKGADCWGWATWKRAWDLFEPDGLKLMKEIRERKLQREFDFNGSYPYLKMLRDQIEGKISSWAVRWLASAFLQEKLCLYFGEPLVQNIGFGSDGTHCVSTSAFNVQTSGRYIRLERVEPRESPQARALFEEFFLSLQKRTRGNFFFRKEKIGRLRILTFLGIIKVRYKNEIF